jgi:D-cysteine desulfhydrase
MIPNKKHFKLLLIAYAFASGSFLCAARPSLGERCNALNEWMGKNSNTAFDPYLIATARIPLFEFYPHLIKHIPYFDIAQLPTPVKILKSLGRQINHDNLYIKNDSGTGHAFGGNKVRKLCFLLGQAIYHKADYILTVGGAGSNHSAATIVLSSRSNANIPCISFLSPQLPTAYTRRNLIISQQYGGELHACKSANHRAESVLEKAAELQSKGKKIVYIPSGGSNALGCLGYVNAAFELKKQIDAGEIPKPDCIFIAAGSNGTAAGLSLGLALAGLNTQVIAVITVPMTSDECRTETTQLIKEMCNLLKLSCCPKNIIYPHHTTQYFGGEYARIGDTTAEALSLMLNTEGFKLDGTYAGKALTAFIDHAQAAAHKNKVLLLWNTFFTDEPTMLLDDGKISNLPKEFHHYFTDPLQPGDLGL